MGNLKPLSQTNWHGEPKSDQPRHSILAVMITIVCEKRLRWQRIAALLTAHIDGAAVIHVMETGHSFTQLFVSLVFAWFRGDKLAAVSKFIITI